MEGKSKIISGCSEKYTTKVGGRKDVFSSENDREGEDEGLDANGSS